MNKKTYIIALLIIVSNAFSQKNFGIKAGGILSEIEFNSKKVYGYSIGGFVDYKLRFIEKLYFETGLSYTQQGGEYSYTKYKTVNGTSAFYSYKTDLMQYYLKVPIVAKYNLDNVYLLLGPEISYLVKSSYSDGINKFDCGILAGVRYVHDGIFIEAIVGQGLIGISQNSWQYKNTVFQLCVGIVIDKKKQ